MLATQTPACDRKSFSGAIKATVLNGKKNVKMSKCRVIDLKGVLKPCNTRSVRHWA